MLHFPVLLEESIDFLVQKVDGNFIDCTYGRGGHSSAILDKLTKWHLKKNVFGEQIILIAFNLI